MCELHAARSRANCLARNFDVFGTGYDTEIRMNYNAFGVADPFLLNMQNGNAWRCILSGIFISVHCPENTVPAYRIVPVENNIHVINMMYAQTRGDVLRLRGIDIEEEAIVFHFDSAFIYGDDAFMGGYQIEGVIFKFKDTRLLSDSEKRGMLKYNADSVPPYFEFLTREIP
jgi:hypothetical protein